LAKWLEEIVFPVYQKEIKRGNYAPLANSAPAFRAWYESHVRGDSWQLFAALHGALPGEPVTVLVRYPLGQQALYLAVAEWE
jgi:hypothetical protein